MLTDEFIYKEVMKTMVKSLMYDKRKKEVQDDDLLRICTEDERMYLA